MEFEYRILEPEDIIRHKNKLTALMKVILEDNITQNFPADLAQQYVDKIPGYIADGSAIVSGAFYGDELAGFCWGYQMEIFGEKRIHIDMICVDSAYRKNGIAKRLMDMQVEEAVKRGVYIMEAMTTRANENSYQWFHSMGFTDERVKVKRELGK